MGRCFPRLIFSQISVSIHKYYGNLEWSQIDTIQAVIYIGARSSAKGQAANQTPELTANDTCHKVHI